MADDAAPESAGRTGLIVASVAAAVIALIGIFGAHGASVWAVPQVLQSDIARELTAAGLGGVDIEMDGQDARLLGFVGDSADIARAQRMAYAASGAGGPWAGGVTNVDITGLAVGRVDHPYTFRVTRRGNQFTLEGAVPSDRARRELIARAQRAAPNAAALDRMHVAGGAPSPYWRAIALGAIQQLARLGRGQARLNGANLVVVGDGSREQVQAVRDYYATPLPAPFAARADLTVTGEPLAIPELAGVDLSNASAQSCSTAFERLMATNVITFASGSSAIEDESRPLLNNLAMVARRCDGYAIEVAGHTDNLGAREANLELSRRRAMAVVAYLSQQNVAAERMTAVGFGPDRPVANNSTPQGQAANRRIVFTVRG